jgi:TRAP-type C4-dicarboxylate transport system permease small subunit
MVVVLYAVLAWQAWPLMLIAADERSPMLGVPGSWSVGCLMAGFALLSVVTLSQLPGILSGTSPKPASEDDALQGAFQ